MTAPRSPRGSVPDPYAGKTDDQVLMMAANALRQAAALPPHTSARKKHWKTFDRSMGELMRRGMMHTLQKVHEMELAGNPLAPTRDPADTILKLIERNGVESLDGGDDGPGDTEDETG